MQPTSSPAFVPSSGPIPHHDIAPWSKVSFGPPADWIENQSYDATVRGSEGAHLTQLLWSRQALAGTGRSFHSTAVRLETGLAVEQESQWSVQLDPRAKSLTLHWLRVVRADRVIDHLHRERLRLIQRETQLEQLIINGTWTLMSVLEDVRPGDILEAAYTYENAQPIRPGSTEAFFIVPPQMLVGRYHFGVVSTTGDQGLDWQASSDAPILREDTLPDGRRRWTWEGAQLTPREPEPNQPASALDHIWVQVSDLVNWSDLAQHLAEVWATHDDLSGVQALPGFARPDRVDEAAVHRFIQRIQDEFRYLSVSLAQAGWIPSAPSLVARRRHGDCKDLAWLATAILQSWGLAARPVLVDAGLRERVATLLPMARLFNHAVLEVEIAGKTRWFDLTERQQGGDFTGQAVGWFGFGLPVDRASTGLIEQPGERAPGLYSLRETILVNTRLGEPSLTELRLLAEGWQADNLRRLRHALGVDEFAKDRELEALRRYRNVRRIGTLQWRDDRAKNSCELVETFEFTNAVYPDTTGQLARFDVPPNLVALSFPLPENKPRRASWALPFPLEIRHEITIKSPSMGLGNRRSRRFKEPGFSGFLDEPRVKGAWTKAVHFTVNTPEITPDQMPNYRRHLERFLSEIGWRLQLPLGQPCVFRGKGFGQLSVVPEHSPSPAAPDVSAAEENAVAPVSPPAVLTAIKLAPGERRVNSQVKLRSGERRRRSAAQVNIPVSSSRLALPLLILVSLALLVFIAKILIR